MLKVEERLRYKEPLETKITKKEISVKDRMVSIREILLKKTRCRFEELFEAVNKEYIIATFLAILEMSKQKEILLKQDGLFESILVERIV